MGPYFLSEIQLPAYWSETLQQYQECHEMGCSSPFRKM